VTPRSERDRSLPAYERGGVRAAWLRAIKVDIGKHLCEPALSLDMIAMRQGISPRYVRKLFQEEQTTFSDFVLLCGWNGRDNCCTARHRQSPRSH
jgi:hypothetical protein